MPIEKIVIAGGGVAAWLSALALARHTTCAIIVLEEGEDFSLGLPLAVETTLPSILKFHELVGLDTNQVVTQTGSSYALGRALSNWTMNPAPAFHPYGDIGASLGPIGFQHLVSRLRDEGLAVNFANYSLGALCAQSDRFAPPRLDSRSVLSTMAFGLHLNISEYRHLIRNTAMLLGVEKLDGQPTKLTLDDKGVILSFDTNTGHTLNGDLFIDCTGQARRLARELPHFGFEDWSHWLPCNHARTVTSCATMPPQLYAHIDAHLTGWQRFAATQTSMEELVITNSKSPDGFAFCSGRIASPWMGNCIAIGGSAAIIDPLASTQLHLAGKAIERLLKLFPNDKAATVEASEYNRQTIEELEGARDFAIAHYKCNGRIGEAFWDDCRSMTVPDRLAHKVALYESCGRMALHDEESFEQWDWISVFDASGVRPRNYDTMAKVIPKDRIETFLAQVRTVMLKAVGSMPTQQEYLQLGKDAA